MEQLAIMDGAREDAESSFPDYYLDFMEVDWDANCDQCPSGVVNGEHVADQVLPSRPDDTETVDPVGTEGPGGDTEGVAGSVEASPQPEKTGDGAMTDDESMVDGGVHPLLFPDVVKDILSHLPAKDVETCRLVCRVWNTEACKVLRSKRIVVFMDSDSVRVYNKAMRDTTDFPHAQFEICIQDFTGIVDENLREFWTIFGPHIRSLEFRQTHVFWRDFLDVVEEKLPHLERIAMRHLPRNIRSRSVMTERQHQIPSVKELRLASLPSTISAATERLGDLLKALPNLEVLEFLPIKSAAAKVKVSSVLVDILRKPDLQLPNLRRLDLSLELTNEGLEGLATKQFQLEKLYISLVNGVKASAFKDFLCSLRPSLKELQIAFPESFSNYQSFVTQNNSMKPEESVQVLSNLKTLYMTNFRGSINFVQNLPQLELLEFTTSNLEKSIPLGFKKANGRSANFGLTRVDDHSLKILKVISLSACTVAETLTLESISRCFPYLTCLKLQGVDDDGLGVIYRNLPFLSDVEFTKATCTDQGLTGIPLEICNDMVETSTFIVVQAERYRRDLFIGSLQFLRKFSIVASKISDASIALGLVDCKNLKELKIGSPLITDTGVIFVTDKFHKQLDCLDVSECTEITEQSKFYAGEKLVGKLYVCDVPPEPQNQTKPIVKEVVHNPDRGIIKTKKTTSTTFGASTPHSKFLVQDSEFFEEHSEDDLMRERGFPHPPFPAEHNNRLRIIRIREALRRNEDFMRNLQRMGLQQFRRLYGRDLQEAEQERRVERIERNVVIERNIRGMPRIRRGLLVNVEAVGIPPPINDPIPVELEHVQAEGNNAFAGGGRNPGEEAEVAVFLQEDDGGPAGGDIGPDRLPEIHLAEIFRLGLRLEDVEYWLRNRGLFEREDNGNPNLDPQIRHIRADVLFAGMNLGDDEPPLGGIGAGEDEDIDLEAIRRVVMNAFGEDLPFEG